MTEKYTEQQWADEGRRRFGANMQTWRFVCPVCGHEASVSDWLAAGATEGEVAFSCVGRHRPGAKDAFADGDNSLGCTYAGGGLFRMNPVQVVRDGLPALCLFAFASSSHVEPPAVTLDGRLA